MRTLGSLLGYIGLLVCAALVSRAEARTPAPPTAYGGSVTYRILDRQHGLVAATMSHPPGWRGSGSVVWNYADVSLPVRLSSRVAAPDGSAWVEIFPSEMFYWLQPHDSQVRVGGQSLGMIHDPGITAEQALRRYVIRRYRGQVQGLQIGALRPVNDPTHPPGEALTARVRYLLAGHQVDASVDGGRPSPSIAAVVLWIAPSLAPPAKSGASGHSPFGPLPSSSSTGWPRRFTTR